MTRFSGAIVAALVIATASLESAEPHGAAPATAEPQATVAAKAAGAPASAKPETPAKSGAHISSAEQAPPAALEAPGSPAGTGAPVPLLRRPSWLPAKPEAVSSRPSILRRPAWLDAKPGEERTPHIVRTDAHGPAALRAPAPGVKPGVPATPTPQAPAATNGKPGDAAAIPVPPVRGVQLPPGLVAALANEPAAKDRVIIRPMGPPPMFGRRRRVAVAPAQGAAPSQQPHIIEPLLPSRHFALRWPPRPRVILEWPTPPGEFVLTWPAAMPESAPAEPVAEPFADGGPFPAP